MIDKIVLDFFNDVPSCPSLLDEYNGGFADIVYRKNKWKHKVRVENGCSKFVLIFKDLDYVIKVPMNACANEDYCPEEYWDEEEDGPYDYDESYAQEMWTFENGGSRFDGDGYWDYCAVEEELSESAIEEGLEFVVLPTTYLGEVNGYRLYKQPKVDEVWGYRYLDDADEDSKEKVRTYRSKSDGACRFSNAFVLKCIETFSEEFCNKFFKWIEENNISDLHGDNYGLRNGHVVVFDYSGFDS